MRPSQTGASAAVKKASYANRRDRNSTAGRGTLCVSEAWADLPCEHSVVSSHQRVQWGHEGRWNIGIDGKVVLDWLCVCVCVCVYFCIPHEFKRVLLKMLLLVMCVGACVCVCVCGCMCVCVRSFRSTKFGSVFPFIFQKSWTKSHDFQL